MVGRSHKLTQESRSKRVADRYVGRDGGAPLPPRKLVRMTQIDAVDEITVVLAFLAHLPPGTLSGSWTAREAFASACTLYGLPVDETMKGLVG